MKTSQNFFIRSFYKTIFFIFFLTLLSACSSSNQNTSDSTSDIGIEGTGLNDGGIEGTGISSGGAVEGSGLNGGIEGTGIINPTANVITNGVISGFGSIYVNGIKYDSSDAIIHINSNTNSTDDDLKLGMLVQIIAKINSDGLTGTAYYILYDQVLRGPVSNIQELSVHGKTFDILGLTVLTSSRTVFDNTDFDSLRDGQVLEVSGFKDNSLTLQATRINKIEEHFTVGEEIELEHQVNEIDFEEQTLLLGNLKVDISLINIEDFPETLVSKHITVEVKGENFNQLGELIASSIKIKQSIQTHNHNNLLEIEGIINNFKSISDFMITDQKINAENATISKGTIGDLDNGYIVEAEGPVDAQQVLQAQVIVIKKASDKAINGVVTGIDIANSTIFLNDIAVTLDTLTRYEDQSSLENRYLHLTNLFIGDQLRIDACLVEGDLIANSILRMNSKNRINDEIVAAQDNSSQEEDNSLTEKLNEDSDEINNNNSTDDSGSIDDDSELEDVDDDDFQNFGDSSDIDDSEDHDDENSDTQNDSTDTTLNNLSPDNKEAPISSDDNARIISEDRGLADEMVKLVQSDENNFNSSLIQSTLLEYADSEKSEQPENRDDPGSGDWAKTQKRDNFTAQAHDIEIKDIEIEDIEKVEEAKSIENESPDSDFDEDSD